MASCIMVERLILKVNLCVLVLFRMVPLLLEMFTPKYKELVSCWDAYLVKPKTDISSYALLFLSKVLQKTIKEKYSYDNKAIWDKVKKDYILLPQDSEGEPDWYYMDSYMRSLETRSKSAVNILANLLGGG